MASVPRVAASDIPGAINALEKGGAVILSNFTTAEHVEQVNKDLKPLMEDVAKLQQPEDFFPKRVRTCYSVYGKSKTLRESWALDPTFQSISKHFLCTFSIPWQGERTQQVMSDPVLTTSVSLNILPGAEAQLLHRDDMSWQRHHQDRTGDYNSNTEQCIGLLIPGTDFFKENGATLVVLGSHLWPHEKRANQDQAVCCEMEKGDALIILGSVAHGGGANLTAKERILHSVFFCRGYLRPEENIFPLFSKDEVYGWSPEARELAGYKKGALSMGHAGGKDPHNVLQNFVASDQQNRAEIGAANR